MQREKERGESERERERILGHTLMATEEFNGADEVGVERSRPSHPRSPVISP